MGQKHKDFQAIQQFGNVLLNAPDQQRINALKSVCLALDNALLRDVKRLTDSDETDRILITSWTRTPSEEEMNTVGKVWEEIVGPGGVAINALI